MKNLLFLIVSLLCYSGISAQIFGSQEIIDLGVWQPFEIYSADLNGDGSQDILTAALDQNIYWHSNDGYGNFGMQQTVGSMSEGALWVRAADFDNDGDLDVLAAAGYSTTSTTAGEVSWFQNDGNGNFGAANVIALGFAVAYCAEAGDIDGDGDIDVVASSYNDSKFSWFSNDGSGNFGPEQIIDNFASGASEINLIDVDGDNDLDVIGIKYNSNSIGWYQNDGLGNFGAVQQIITSASQPLAIESKDIDGDGDPDLFSGSAGNGKIAWYTNDGSGNYGPQQTIYQTAGLNPYSVRSEDFDGDGDYDVAWSDGFGNQIFWSANNGSGIFDPAIQITNVALFSKGIRAADLDGDGDIDLASCSDGDNKIAWYQNNPTSGCTSPTACNYYAIATIDDGSCIEPVGCQTCSGAVDGTGTVINNDIDGDGVCDSTDSDDDNDGVIDANDTDPIDPFVCQDLDNDGCDDCSNGIDGFGPLNDFDPLNDGFDPDGDGICDAPVLGCTSPTACNFVPTANIDDGTCIEPTGCDYCATHPSGIGILVSGDCNGNGICDLIEISGCTYSFAANYDPSATINDGSCVEKCQGDFNADNVVSAADLLVFLSILGTPCTN